MDSQKLLKTQQPYQSYNYQNVQQPATNVEKTSSCYGPCGDLQATITPCGPQICYTCPSPNNKNLWFRDTKQHTEIDPVRQNIYYGGTICSFEPRDKINDMMCARNFLNSPARSITTEFPHLTDIGFYLRHGESSACSSFWKYRYDKQNPNLGDSGRYEKIGPAPL